MNKLKAQTPKFFVVWTSVYGGDNMEFANMGAAILNDKRVKQYYEKKPDLVALFGKIVPLPRDTPLAYDVYFLYDQNTEWTKPTPPTPFDWWHQVIEDERYLNGNVLREKIETLLKPGSQAAPAERSTV